MWRCVCTWRRRQRYHHHHYLTHHPAPTGAAAENISSDMVAEMSRKNRSNNNGSKHRKKWFWFQALQTNRRCLQPTTFLRIDFGKRELSVTFPTLRPRYGWVIVGNGWDRPLQTKDTLVMNRRFLWFYLAYIIQYTYPPLLWVLDHKEFPHKKVNSCHSLVKQQVAISSGGQEVIVESVLLLDRSRI